MKNIPKLIPVAYFKAYKDDGTLVWGEDCVSATNDFEEADYTGVALVRLSDVAALSEVECENCNQLVRALREAVEGPTFMGEPVFTPTTATAAQAEPVAVATFPPRIMEVLLEIADRKGTTTRGPWEDGDGLPLQDAADEAIAWISRATPQPPTAEPGQPSSAVVVVVPDEIKHLEDCQRKYEYGDSASMGYRDGWNDCRDEMLHAMKMTLPRPTGACAVCTLGIPGVCYCGPAANPEVTK